MKYNTGSTVKVRLYSGRIVTANITDIVSRSAGRKIHIAYDNATGVVNPAQIIEVAETLPVEQSRVPDAAPAAAVRKRPTSQVVREIAEDYLQLARNGGGTPDTLRESNYRWLMKLADKIRAKSPLRPL
ncbi:MAG TPA: hypothetical protein VN780_00940 [Candidatus Eisenbacteria bacterium]|jgi:hypothetical protein|nr:hypothetical protein [Candidatus Eisenbacteria bacterium]